MTHDNDDFCPVTEDHKHRPNPKTLNIQTDGDAFYIDINCDACGRSGCCGRYDPNEVTW